MKLSPAGASFIKHWEECRLSPYYDQTGLATIGWGHLLSREPYAPLSQWQPITQAEADALFLEDVAPAESGVSVLFMGHDLKQGQFDALVSFAFNTGVNALAGSTLRRVIENGQPIAAIRNAFGMWNKVRDTKTRQLVVSAGLAFRRKAEADMYEGAK